VLALAVSKWVLVGKIIAILKKIKQIKHKRVVMFTIITIIP